MSTLHEPVGPAAPVGADFRPCSGPGEAACPTPDECAAARFCRRATTTGVPYHAPDWAAGTILVGVDPDALAKLTRERDEAQAALRVTAQQLTEAVQRSTDLSVENGRLQSLVDSLSPGTTGRAALRAVAGMAWSDIASSAYMAYAASTGGKNFRGEPMPAFEDLPQPIRTAWEAAVRQAGDCIERPRGINDPRRWTGWLPPGVPGNEDQVDGEVAPGGRDTEGTGKR